MASVTVRETGQVRQPARSEPAAASKRRGTSIDDLQGMQLLLELGDRLVPEGNLQVLYEEVLQAAITLANADAGTLQILDDSTSELVLLVTRGFERTMTDHFARVDCSSRTSCGAALKTGLRTVVHFDEPGAPDPDGSLRMHVDAGYRSAQSTPLQSRSGQAIGMLSTHWSEHHAPTERELRYLDLLARQAADLIERKKFDDALRASESTLKRELDDVMLLHEASTRLIEADDASVLHHELLRAAVSLMRSEGGCVQVLDEASGELRLLAWQGIENTSAAHWARIQADSRNVCATALREGQRIVVGDVEDWDAIASSENLEFCRRCGIRAVQSTPLLSRNGKPVGVLSTHWRVPHEPSGRELRLLDVVARQAADLIERRRSEDRLRESEERFRLLVESLAQAVWETDADGIVLTDSPSWRGYTGQGKDALFDGGWIAAIHPEDREFAQRSWEEVVRSGKHLDAEFRIWSASAGWRWTNVKATPLRDVDGRVRKWIGMNIDVTARKDAEAALRDADRRKDEFLATLSHELRNPLAPLRQGVQIARMTAARSDHALQRVVEMMDRQLAHLVRLVDDLLDVGRIQSGKLEMRHRPTVLDDVLLSSVEAARAGIDAQRHELVVECGGPQLRVMADFDRLVQVFTNLLSNAAKYSQPGSRIFLRLQDEGGQAVVRVSDEGIGIPQAELPHVFDLFSQVRSHQGRSDGGLGIGLAIVRSLVTLHGGSVVAESDGPGRGSTFTVRLPILSMPHARAPAENATAAPARESTSRRILVVDDNVDAGDALAALLELLGHRVAVARDGLEAIRVASTHAPELVFLDVGMPLMDGIEAARRLRGLPGGERLRIIALTGWGQRSDRQRTREAGFDCHIVKPIDEATLVATLEQLGKNPVIN